MKEPRKTSSSEMSAALAGAAAAASTAVNTPARRQAARLRASMHERQVIETPPYADTHFMRGQILQGHGAGIAADRQVAEVQVAVAEVDHEIGRDGIAETAHQRPGQLPLRVRGAGGERRGVAGGMQSRGADAGADVRRRAIPGAEIEIAVEQRGDGV